MSALSRHINPFLVILTLWLSHMTTGCAGGAPSKSIEEPVGTGGSRSEPTIPSGDASSGSDSDASDSAPHLNSSHPGWKRPLCFDCHGNTAPAAHPSETYRPPDCVGCHGYNGAMHQDHAVAENTGCAACHATVTHVPAFNAPADCIRCHNHPQNPEGN